MELYTSLTRIKLAMNGGVLPPMTPVPESVYHLIDPAFTIGLGAFAETERDGLRCPVRGCGRWYHSLGHHIRAAHADIGGCGAVRSALSIPRTAPLSSTFARERKRAAHDGKMGHLRTRAVQLAAQDARRRVNNSGTRYTMGARNLRDRCEAQIRSRLIELQLRLGRAPSYSETRIEIGRSFVKECTAIYGTWDNVLAQLGLDRVWRPGMKFTSAHVLPGLRAYYDAHGCLPSAKMAIYRNRRPLIASYRATLRCFGVKSWPEAMRRAASLLNIYGGRYGLPPKKQSAA